MKSELFNIEFSQLCLQWSSLVQWTENKEFKVIFETQEHRLYMQIKASFLPPYSLFCVFCEQLNFWGRTRTKRVNRKENILLLYFTSRSHFSSCHLKMQLFFQKVDLCHPQLKCPCYLKKCFSACLKRLSKQWVVHSERKALNAL